MDANVKSPISEIATQHVALIPISISNMWSNFATRTFVGRIKMTNRDLDHPLAFDESMSTIVSCRIAMFVLIQGQLANSRCQLFASWAKLFIIARREQSSRSILSKYGRCLNVGE
jgi:hypothetical protein